MNEPCITASSMTPTDECDGDTDGFFALSDAPSGASVDAECLTPGQQLLMQHVKQMTSFLG